MGEYEDRYPDSYGRGEEATQATPREELKHSAEPPRQVRDETFMKPRTGLGGTSAQAWQHAPSPPHTAAPPPAAATMPGAMPGAMQRPPARLTPAEAAAAQRLRGSYRGIGPRGYRRSDARTYEDICDRLTENPFIDASDIEVMVRDGEIMLSGTVDSAISAYQAESIARETAGVLVVRNNLAVRYRDKVVETPGDR